MEIKRNSNENEMILSIIGRLDTNTSPMLEGELKNNLEGVTRLILDFTSLEYISSAGLRVLLSAQKQMNGKGELLVRNVSEDIREIFDMTGFSDILTIE